MIRGVLRITIVDELNRAGCVAVPHLPFRSGLLVETETYNVLV